MPRMECPKHNKFSFRRDGSGRRREGARRVFISALPPRPATRLRMRGGGDRLCAKPNGTGCIWWRSAQLFFLARHARAIRARECK